MKKIVCTLAATLLLVACNQEDSATIRGNTYALSDTPEGMEIILSFAPNEDRFFGQAVNRYFGTYKIEGNKLILGPVGSTMMMGPEHEMTAEKDYFDALAQVNTFTVTPDTLTLTLSDNKTLTFHKTALPTE